MQTALSLLIALFVVAGLAALSWRRTRRTPKGWLLVLSVLMFVTCVWLVIWDLGEIRSARRVKAWPTVTGTVIRSEIVGDRAIRPLIVYTYRVGETVFTDSTSLGVPSFGNRRIRQDESSKLTAEYAAGDTVTVHYNPQNPGYSLLYAREDWAMYVRLSLGVFLGIGGLLLLRWTLRR
ncbi:MAG: DUF3592 domain-containing protein [candidate division Zixibacteria bacterium]|nr:DUF3592 domain-containing protein [candidate division Zixibacteria bacterium]